MRACGRGAAIRRIVSAARHLNLSVIDPLRPGDEDAARLINGQHNRIFLDPILRGSYPQDVLDDLIDLWPARGYAKRLGIVRVDYDTLERTPNDSALRYAELIAAACD